tara:strand:+ start:4131 stop:4787 length:657 start_codon:yes stop_codon:yes gene_type:complete
MASRAGIDTKTALRLAQDHQEIKFAIKAEFDTDTVRLHTGGGTLTINSENYEGAGTLLAISEIEDTKELKSSGVTFQLSGMDSTVLGFALSENYQNRPITLFMAFTSGGTNNVDGFLTLYSGRMTQADITDTSEGATITLNTENRLIDLSRPCNLRYTNESQEHLFAGDTSLNQIHKVTQMQIFWGRSGQGGGGSSIAGMQGGASGSNIDDFDLSSEK